MAPRLTADLHIHQRLWLQVENPTYNSTLHRQAVTKTNAMVSCAIIACNFAAILAGVAKNNCTFILDVVSCAIIARNAMQFLHAIIAGFQTC